MSELYKLLKKKSPKVEHVSSNILTYEQLMPKHFESDVKLVSEDYEVGIEIEVEKISNIDGPLEYGIWTPKEDHSLRDNGIEYVSVPIKGKRIIYALNQFYSTISPGYRFSPRCSVHIHLNVLDLTSEQVGVAVGATSLVETLLYKFVGGDRHKSNFAVPFKDADAFQYIEYFLDQKLNFNLQEYRYLGLNLDSIRKFGTLEFRHLGGTDDVKKILTWINLIFCLKKFAIRTTWTAFKYRVDRLNTDSSYYAIVDEIFGEAKASLDLKDLIADLSYPASELKRIKLENPLKTKIYSEKVVACHWYKLLTEVKPVKKTNEYVFERPAPAGAGRQPPRERAQRVDVRIDGVGLRVPAGRAGRRDAQAEVVPAPAFDPNQFDYADENVVDVQLNNPFIGRLP